MKRRALAPRQSKRQTWEVRPPTHLPSRLPDRIAAVKQPGTGIALLCLNEPGFATLDCLGLLLPASLEQGLADVGPLTRAVVNLSLLLWGLATWPRGSPACRPRREGISDLPIGPLPRWSHVAVRALQLKAMSRPTVILSVLMASLRPRFQDRDRDREALHCTNP